MYTVVGVVKNDRTIVGYRLYNHISNMVEDLTNRQTYDIVYNERVTNAKIKSFNIELTDGSVNSLPSIDVGTYKTSNDNVYIVLSEQWKDGQKVGYKVINFFGNNFGTVSFMTESQLIEAIERNGACNAKVVTRNSKKYISTLKGSFRIEGK